MMTAVMSAVVTAVVPAVMTAKMMSIVMSAVAPRSPVAIAVTTIAIWRIEPRHIHVGRRIIAIIFASPMTAAAAMAMSIATLVGKLYQV